MYGLDDKNDWEHPKTLFQYNLMASQSIDHQKLLNQGISNQHDNTKTM